MRQAEKPEFMDQTNEKEIWRDSPVEEDEELFDVLKDEELFDLLQDDDFLMDDGEDYYKDDESDPLFSNDLPFDDDYLFKDQADEFENAGIDSSVLDSLFMPSLEVGGIRRPPVNDIYGSSPVYDF